MQLLESQVHTMTDGAKEVSLAIVYHARLRIKAAFQGYFDDDLDVGGLHNDVILGLTRSLDSALKGNGSANHGTTA